MLYFVDHPGPKLQSGEFPANERLPSEASDDLHPVPTRVPVLLPHEIIHALSEAGDAQA